MNFDAAKVRSTLSPYNTDLSLYQGGLTNTAGDENADFGF